MKIEINQTTLIDQVEDSLLTYFKKNDLGRGDSIPNENSLAAELGVARSVVREALSRLKMMGLIHARPRKGMVLTEPSIILECKKFPSQAPIEGMPRTYIGEILKAKIK